MAKKILRDYHFKIMKILISFLFCSYFIALLIFCNLLFAMPAQLLHGNTPHLTRELDFPPENTCFSSEHKVRPHAGVPSSYRWDLFKCMVSLPSSYYSSRRLASLHCHYSFSNSSSAIATTLRSILHLLSFILPACTYSLPLLLLSSLPLIYL